MPYVIPYVSDEMQGHYVRCEKSIEKSQLVKKLWHLKLSIVSKIINRMAGNSKLRSLYLLNRLCFFDNFFTLEFVLMCSFKITDYFCHNEKKQFWYYPCDVIFPPKTVKIEKNKNHTIVWNSNVCRLAKFELP